MKARGSSNVVIVLTILVALVGFLCGVLVGSYLNPRYVIETTTITTSIPTTVILTKTEVSLTTTTITTTVTKSYPQPTITSPPKLTATSTNRISSIEPAVGVLQPSPEQPLRLGIGESKTIKLTLLTCRYEVLEVYLNRGNTIAVEWDSNRMIFVGAGTKQELDTWLTNTLCLSAHTNFKLNFAHSGYGYSGKVEYEAPYTGVHYIVVFTGWDLGTHTADITLKITRTG